MANPFEKLAPEGFQKIAQNDNMNGEVLAVVYFNKAKSEFFVQIMGANNEFITLGPMKLHVFENLAQIMTDVKEMERRYHFLE